MFAPPTTGAQIFQLLHAVTEQGVTVVTATHDPFVMQHADRVLEMSDGQLLGDGEGTLAAEHRAPHGLRVGGEHVVGDRVDHQPGALGQLRLELPAAPSGVPDEEPDGGDPGRHLVRLEV